MNAGVAFIAVAGILLLAVAGFYMATGQQPVAGPSATATTTTETQGKVECDRYVERVYFNDPDPSPADQYYDGYLYWLADGCDVFDVNVSYDYVPSRPMSSDSIYFKVYADGQLVYEGYSNIWDFDDTLYYHVEKEIVVIAYR